MRHLSLETPLKVLNISICFNLAQVGGPKGTEKDLQQSWAWKQDSGFL